MRETWWVNTRDRALCIQLGFQPAVWALRAQSQGSPRQSQSSLTQSQCPLRQSQFSLTGSHSSLRVSERNCDGILGAAQLEVSPNRGLHKLCCSCRTSPSSPYPLCSSHTAVQIKTILSQGSKDLPNTCPFICSCNHICWIFSLPAGVWSSRDAVSLFFSAAVNYDKAMT